MAVLLYYPLVTPPREVIHQSLLYWDGLASVVPRRADVYEAVVPVELRGLEDRGLYQPVALVEESLVAGGFLVDHQDIPPGVVLVEELRRMAARPQPPRPSSPPKAFLYLSKLSGWIEEELLRLGLAAQVSGQLGVWRSLAVSQEVQTLVIGVLARELAHAPASAYVPYTDSEDAYQWSLRPGGHARSLAWEVELGRLLPVPVPDTPIADVLVFREKYADERRRLMRAVHRMLGDLRRDYEHPADVFAQLRVELSQAVEDYRAAAKGSRIAWMHRSVMVTVALAAAAGGAQLVPDLGWLLGTVAGYALNIATREIRPLARVRVAHDFTYLHRVHVELS